MSRFLDGVGYDGPGVRTMYGLAIVAVLAGLGCGDGRMVGSDAEVQVDAGNRGIVRVKVTGFVEKAGLHVYFQESDSTLSLSTLTDANGVATGRLGPDGFVTLVAGREPTLTLWTYAGVQPGDELEFFEPDVVDTQTPTESISVFASNAGAPPLTLRTSCGVQLTIADVLPVALLMPVCSDRMDFLLEVGQVYRYARDVNVDIVQPRVDFVGDYIEYPVSTVTVTDVPRSGTVTQALIGQGFALETTYADAEPANGVVTAHLGLPLPPGATLLTELDLNVDFSDQHIIDWRPATTQVEFHYGDVTVARATEAPRYDASTTSIVWSEDSGTPGNLIRATLHWLDGMHSRTRNWVIVGPRGDEPVLRVPLLPAPDLVPSVEIPQSMESFVVDGQLDWVRRHLHGRWLSQGVAWPTDGETGHIVWRKL